MKYVEYPKPFKRPGRKTWSFMYTDQRGQRILVSTGCRLRVDADIEVRKYVDARTSASGNAPFLDYQRAFFAPETCPHVSRLRDSGRHIGLTHITKCRQWLDLWIVPEGTPEPVGQGENVEAARKIRQFCEKRMNRITRGDLLDLRDQVKVRVRMESKRIEGQGINTVNKVMSAVYTIFSEAYFREHIPGNPADLMGIIKEERKERDVLTLAELKMLFAKKWENELAQDVFRFTELTGMRCSEVLKMVPALQLSGDRLDINAAFKGKEEGKPKHEKTREIILCWEARQIAARHPGGFRQPDGARLGETWWRKNFAKGLEDAKIGTGRHFTPHCLRHSFNTHMLEAGVEPLRIQLYLWGVRIGDPQQEANRRITPIQRNYTHFEVHMTEPVARMAEKLFNAGEPRRRREAAGA